MFKIAVLRLKGAVFFDWLVNNPPAGGEFTNHQSRTFARSEWFWDKWFMKWFRS